MKHIWRVFQMNHDGSINSSIGYFDKLITAQDRIEAELELDRGFDGKMVMWYWNGDDYECWITRNTVPTDHVPVFVATRANYVIERIEVNTAGED